MNIVYIILALTAVAVALVALSEYRQRFAFNARRASAYALDHYDQLLDATYGGISLITLDDAYQRADKADKRCLMHLMLNLRRIGKLAHTIKRPPVLMGSGGPPHWVDTNVYIYVATRHDLVLWSLKHQPKSTCALQ